MNGTFGNALVVKVRDFFAQYEVFKQGRATSAGLERVVVIGDLQPLIGRQDVAGAGFREGFKLLQF